MNNFLYKIFLTGAVLICALLALTNCYTARNLQHRFETDILIDDLEKIRDAQKEFQKKHDGKFGSIDELISERLIDSDVKTFIEKNFKIDLILSEGKYSLSLIPIDKKKTSSNDDVEVLSFYLDESGIIRISLDPNKQADRTSSAINRKR